MEWRSQLRVTDQFTKRVQQSGARMSCKREIKQNKNKTNVAEQLNRVLQFTSSTPGTPECIAHIEMAMNDNLFLVIPLCSSMDF